MEIKLTYRVRDGGAKGEVELRKRHLATEEGAEVSIS